MLAHFVRGAPPKGDQSPFGEPPALREGREILCSHPLEHLLANPLDFLTERLAVFHGEIVQKRALQILLLQLLGVRELESDAPKYLTDAVRRLEGLDVGRRLILLVLIPVQFPKERELAGQVANRFQVAVGQPEDAVGSMSATAERMSLAI